MLTARALLLLWSLATTVTAADAQSPLPPTRVGAPDPPASHDTSWESARAAARKASRWLARSVDSWFGDRPFEDGGAVTDGRISLGFLARQHEDPDVDLRFQARFSLPNVGDRGYLFLGRDNRQEVVTDTPGALTRRQRLLNEARTDQGFFAGLGVELRESFDLRLGLRDGLKPYAQARYRNAWAPSDVGLVELRQTFFWTVHDRLGSTTAVSIERVLTPRWSARWLHSATITQARPRVEWSGVVGGYRDLGQDRLLGLEVVLAGAQHSGVGLTDAGLRMRLERPLYEDWVRSELILGRFWPRPDVGTARRGSWAAGAGVILQF